MAWSMERALQHYQQHFENVSNEMHFTIDSQGQCVPAPDNDNDCDIIDNSLPTYNEIHHDQLSLPSYEAAVYGLANTSVWIPESLVIESDPNQPLDENNCCFLVNVKVHLKYIVATAVIVIVLGIILSIYFLLFRGHKNKV